MGRKKLTPADGRAGGDTAQKNGATGDHYFERLDSYKESTRHLWKSCPELLGQLMIRFANLESRASRGEWFASAIKALSWLWRSAPAVTGLSRCDALLFCSTKKPNFYPATRELAERLARKGKRVALVTNKEWTHFEPSGSGAFTTLHVPQWRQWLYAPSGRRAALRAWRRSLTLLRALYGALRGNGFAPRFMRDPFGFWYESLLAAHRISLLRSVLDQVDPALVMVNNERIAIAAELMEVCKEKKLPVVYFFNETSYRAVIEPMYSDELWVWNDFAAAEIRSELDGFSLPTLISVGSAEIELATRSVGEPTEKEREIRNIIAGRPVAMFLSEYIGLEVLDSASFHKEVIRWLRQGAEALPHWFFLYKPRPLKTNESPPGIELMAGLDNFAMAPGAVDLKQYLVWDNMRAVTALGSTGMFIAAGLGIAALRLETGVHWNTAPVIAAATHPVYSPEEFIDELRRVEQNPVIGRDESAAHFPFRGQTLDRMERLALDRINGVRQQSAAA